MDEQEREIRIKVAQERVIEAAIAYAEGTNPDDDVSIDVELRRAVAKLAEALGDA